MAEEGKATPQPQEQPEMTGKDVSDEIQDIKESKESEVCEPSAEDKEKATEFKNAGNVLYKKNAFAPAIAMYSKAIEKDPTNAVFWSNRAICYIKTEAPGAAVSDATKAIEADRKYIKGYYRRGTAFLMMSKYKKALKDFKQVAKMYPKNKEAKQKARQCERALREAMFAKAIQAEASKPPSEVLDWRNMSVPSSYTGRVKRLACVFALFSLWMCLAI